MIGKLMKMAKSQKPKQLPFPNGDFYGISEQLSPDERNIQLKVRMFLEKEVKPIADKCWLNAEFPMEIIPKFAELDIAGITYQGYTCRGKSNVLEGILAMEIRLSEMQDQGVLKDEHASLAKVFCTKSCREIVAHARSIHGGNGILLENDVGRFLADAEALYSYEGTKEVNSLIVGRALTGFSAFV